MLGNVNKHSERFYKGGTFRAGTWTYDYFNRMDNIFESARKVAAFQYRDRIPQKMLTYETKLRDWIRECKERVLILLLVISCLDQKEKWNDEI